VSLTLHLGVTEIPYSQSGGKTKTTPNETTGDVADILEAKYGIMQFFFDHHAAEIAKVLEEGLAGSFESLLSGAPPRRDPFMSGVSKVEAMFRQFLERAEMNGQVAGVPTKASLKGVSHRFKHPSAKRGARPSFIDTALFEQSFRSWVDAR
jgi:hypothetical protein